MRLISFSILVACPRFSTLIVPPSHVFFLSLSFIDLPQLSAATGLLENELLSRRAQGQVLRLRLMGIRLSQLQPAGSSDGDSASACALAAFLKPRTAAATSKSSQAAAATSQPSATGATGATAIHISSAGATATGATATGATPGPSGIFRHFSRTTTHNAAAAGHSTQPCDPGGNAAEAKGVPLVPCPVCGVVGLPAGDNAALNRHIDLCLNASTVQLLAARDNDASTRTTEDAQPAAKAAKRTADRPGTLQAFVRQHQAGQSETARERGRRGEDFGSSSH